MRKAKSSARTAAARESSRAGPPSPPSLRRRVPEYAREVPHASNHDGSSRCRFDRLARSTPQPQSPSRTVCRQSGGNRPGRIRGRFIDKSHPQRVGCAHSQLPPARSGASPRRHALVHRPGIEHPGSPGPMTGKMQEFHLKTPNSGPRGLVADRAGNIWFTANSKGYIGMLNPRTGEVTEYPLLDKGADDPHTPVFDQEGTLWFTVQGGNDVGRLDPRTGLIILKKVPTPRALPSGIA